MPGTKSDVQDAKKSRAEGFRGRLILPGEMSFEDFSGMYGSRPPTSPLQAAGSPLQAAGGTGGLPELDIPARGGNNNQMGILPSLGFFDVSSKTVLTIVYLSFILFCETTFILGSE